jgi:transposase
VDLTNSQWVTIEPLLPKPARRSDGRGRPWREPRGVLNGILWILRTGAPWKDLPPRYPPYQTCHRRFQGWVKDGTLQRVMEALGEELKLRSADNRRSSAPPSFIAADYATSTDASPVSEDLEQQDDRVPDSTRVLRRREDEPRLRSEELLGRPPEAAAFP